MALFWPIIRSRSIPLTGATDKGRYGEIVSKGIEEHPAADYGMIVVSATIYRR
jgi:hypothetical protein